MKPQFPHIRRTREWELRVEPLLVSSELIPGPVFAFRRKSGSEEVTVGESDSGWGKGFARSLACEMRNALAAALPLRQLAWPDAQANSNKERG